MENNANNQDLKNYDALKQKPGFRIFKDKFFKFIVILFSAFTAVPLFFIAFYLITKGISSINWDMFTKLPTGPTQPGGGIVNAILGSFELILVSTIIAFPIGLMLGIYLTENKNNMFSKITRFSVEVLQGLPSIVVGILAWIWFVKPFGGFSALSGSLALVILMLPVIAKSTEETMKLVPHTLKEASLSLGVPYSKTIIKVFIPYAASGIITGLLLSIARVAGETAPLLFTAFGNPFINFNLSKPMASMPLVIFTYAGSPFENWHDMAWGASFILIVFVFVLNILAKLLSRRWKQQS